MIVNFITIPPTENSLSQPYFTHFVAVYFKRALRRGIIEVSEKEEPCDVFICFKEHDAKGDRTPDSVFAQEIYEALTEKGYRVFFSRITLENILGTEYEP